MGYIDFGEGIMKKLQTLLFIIIVVFILLISLQYRMEIEGYSSTVESFSNGYVQDVSIVSHRILIPDKEEFSREVIEMIIDNSLKGIMFSYDVNGYPNGLYVTVYLNESSCRSGNSSFKISYTQNIQNGFRYNIKDDPEKFVLEIIEE